MAAGQSLVASEGPGLAVASAKQQLVGERDLLALLGPRNYPQPSRGGGDSATVGELAGVTVSTWVTAATSTSNVARPRRSTSPFAQTRASVSRCSLI
jgi:hypothetical protein